MEKYKYYTAKYNKDFESACIANCIYNLFVINKIKSPISYFDSSLNICLKRDENYCLKYRNAGGFEVLLPQFEGRVQEYKEYNMDSYNFKDIWEVNRQRLMSKIPIIILCDVFYLPYSNCFNKRHGIHGVIAYDYCDDKQEIYIIDDYEWYKNGAIPLSQINIARQSDYFENSSKSKAIPNMKDWFEVCTENWEYEDSLKLIKQNINRTMEYYFCENNSTEFIQGIGGLYKILDIFKGINILRDDIPAIMLELKDLLYTLINRLRFHRFYFKSHITLINSSGFNDFVTCLDNDILQWNALLNLVLKCNILFTEAVWNKILNKFEYNLEREKLRCNLMTSLLIYF